LEIPGVGPKTTQRLLREFGSIANVRRAGLDRLSEVIARKSAERLLAHLEKSESSNNRIPA